MNIPNDLKYTKTHEWCRIEGNNVTIGLTDFAQSELGDIVFVQLPAVGAEAKKESGIATIEAVKTVADLYSPLSGKVIEVNGSLDADPQKINSDCYGDGWIMKIEASNLADLSELLDAAAYGATLH